MKRPTDSGPTDSGPVDEDGGTESKSDGDGLAVRVADVWTSYDGHAPVLKGVSLEVPAGTSLVILGPSGAGKTTLLKTMNGLIPARRGEVEVLGRRLPGATNGSSRGAANGSSLRSLRSQIGYIPQNLGLVKNLPVLHNVLLGALPRTGPVGSMLKRFAPEAAGAAEEALRLVGMEERRDRKAYALSGGERQRVAIARALVQNPRLLLADEFVSELDYIRAREVMDLVQNLRRKMGMTLVTVQHEVDIARRYGDRIVVVRDGVKAAEVGPRELTVDHLRELFRGCPLPAPARDGDGGRGAPAQKRSPRALRALGRVFARRK